MSGLYGVRKGCIWIHKDVEIKGFGCRLLGLIGLQCPGSRVEGFSVLHKG